MAKHAKARVFYLDGYSERFKPSIGMNQMVRVLEADAVEGHRTELLELIERLYEECNRNCEIAVGLAERAHHELNDYAAYLRACDELVGDEDAVIENVLDRYGRNKGQIVCPDSGVSLGPCVATSAQEQVSPAVIKRNRENPPERSEGF